MYYVYFIRSRKDDSVYIGYTNELSKRLKQHNKGKTKSLRSKLPLDLIYYEVYFDKIIARKREIQLKKSWNEKEIILKRLKNKQTAPSSSG